MKNYKWHAYVFISIFIILQPFLKEWLSVGGISINFVLYFFMLFTFNKKKAHALVLAVATGLVYDMMYSPWLGRTIMVFLTATLLVMLIDKRVYRENVPALAVFFLISTFILENINTLLQIGLFEFVGNIGMIQLHLLYMSLYAAVLSIFAGAIYYTISIKGDRQLSMRKRS